MQDPSPNDQLAYSIPEAVAVSRIGRTRLYEFMASGQLPIVKNGTRTLIRREALDALLRSLEQTAA
jgi:excisionase family DNA binding protein